MKKYLLAASLLASTTLFSSASFAATSIMNADGKIAGISGIMVDGSSYTASFLDQFDSSMVYSSDFSLKATTALRDVFLTTTESSLQSFDLTPKYNQAVGCSNTACALTTFSTAQKNPARFDLNYWYNVSNKTAAEEIQNEMDHNGKKGKSLWARSNKTESFVSGVVGYSTGLQVSWEVSPVPVPAAAFLFAPALLGFMGLRRKSKRA